jgi:hypothetical protein
VQQSDRSVEQQETRKPMRQGNKATDGIGLFQVFLKTPEELACFVYQGFNGCNINIEIADLSGELEKILSFSQRPSGNVDKSGELFVTSPAVAFDDICWDRESCSAKLAGKTEELMAWKRFGYFVNGNAKLMSFLPDNEFSMIRHEWTIALSFNFIQSGV